MKKMEPTSTVVGTQIGTITVKNYMEVSKN